ncbi:MULTISPECIES: golvesin C-terminal-like domain-containing protein [unclassified Saccharicrinis]|uniref:golvesin C-terminal-like domain-containing protein n=1 Tax=unclassified Saccharicrinis TaxID=2646859 RepID=UPI003D34E03F
MYNPLFTVARFEVKTLLRSWFFRIFSLIAIGVLLVFNIGAATEIGRANWPDRMMVGGLPYMNLWVLNIVQAIIAVFLSADFLSRDKKLDTTEVIYVRNMSNFQYVIGKTLGILTVFGGLNLVALAITFVMNFISPDAGFSLLTYVLYPLIISFPTLVFILGLSFFIMQLVRNQSVTFILVLGYIATTIFYLKGKHFGVWDFITFNTPLAYSSYVGFTNVTQLLLIRGGYFLIGIAFILLTIYKLPRLSQTKLGSKVMVLPAVLIMFMALSGISYYLWGKINNEKQIQRQAQLEKELPINAGYEISDYDIVMEHKGNHLTGSVSFNVVSSKNENFPAQLIFFFNNGLKVKEILLNGSRVSFTQELNLLYINNNLKSAESLPVRISFKGTPNDKLAYFDISREERDALHRYDPLVADKKSCFSTSNYVLLTKESYWYPVVAERNALRIQKFFTYNMKVKSSNGLNFISQGIKTNNDGWTYFKGDKPYTKISLAAGHYITKSIDVDSVNYAVSVREDGFFFEKYFENLSDTLPFLITEIKEDYERKLGVRYPYNRLSVVEVPLHFYAHFRGWSISNDNTHPEMIFVPEVGAGINDFNLASRFQNEERRAKRDNLELLDKELETNVFMNLIGNTFAQPVQSRRFFRNENNVGRTLDSWSAYSVFPLYYNYVYALNENDLPFLNMCLESYMLNRVHSSSGRFGRMSSTDKSILFLNKNKGSLKELVDKDDLEISIADIIVTVGNNQFAIAQSRVGVDNFSTYIDSLLGANKMKVIDQGILNELITGDKHGKNTIDAETSIALPSFLFGESQIYEFKDGNRKRYYVSIEVANQGETDGIVKASLFGGRSGRDGGGSRGGGGNRGGGGPGGGRGGMTSSFEEIYLIEKGQNVQIGIVLDNAPRMMSIHTYLSKNVPSDVRFPMADFEEAPAGFSALVGKTPLKKEIKLTQPNEIIVDNENEGFSVVNTSGRKTLKEMILTSQDEENEENGSEYKTLSFFRPPARWTPVLNSLAFGEYTKSVSYKKAGDGNAVAQFKAKLGETGRYNLYAMIPSQRLGNFRGRDPKDAVYTFTVYHDDGQDMVEVPVDQDDADWAFLGEYYFSEGDAVVELSDKTTKRVVIADAVKWVKL